MQQGSIIRSERKRGPAVWQFRWSETGPQGRRVYRKRVVGTVEEYASAPAIRDSVKGLIAKPRSSDLRMKPVAMTVAALCQHFKQRELVLDDNWRSYSARRNYTFLLDRWIIPRWGDYELREIRTIEVESWLRSLARARSTCAKIRNLMSILFNPAWQYEVFDRNPIRLVRQSSKRRTAPNVLIPAEIKLHLDNLELRERTLVLLAASTGLRQSESFALKWGDIDFLQGTMNVTRSIAYGIVGRCKTEASQKPGPVHPIHAAALIHWRDRCRYREPEDWVFANDHHRGPHPYWGQVILRPLIRPVAERIGNQEADWLAHVPPDLLDAAEERRDGIQNHAGAVAAFVSSIHHRHLYPSGHAGQARGASRGVVPRFPAGSDAKIQSAEHEYSKS
jgi:integrase